MRITHTTDATARLVLEEYADMLKVRCLPDYRYVAAREVECDTADLETIGLGTKIDRTPIDVASHLFDYQEWITIRAVERERFAVFADTGLGKTAIQLEWARIVTQRHQGRTLILAPLSV